MCEFYKIIASVEKHGPKVIMENDSILSPQISYTKREKANKNKEKLAKKLAKDKKRG